MSNSGDSWTSTSFNTDGYQPNPLNPLGNPAYPGATSSNGPNYVDFLTTTYNDSYIQTYNLGYGGATIDPAVIESSFGESVQSFQQQVEDEFLPHYVNRGDVPWTGKNSLFIIFFGINDINEGYRLGNNDSLVYDLIVAYEKHVYEVSTQHHLKILS